jgi:hypothetical protein
MDIGAFARAACEIVQPRPRGGRGAQPVQNDLVLQYKMKLEAALGDDEKFSDTMNDLCANDSMGKLEIAALTKEMTGGSARTIDAALKKIWNRHKALVVFKAKSRATKGRSAA